MCLKAQGLTNQLKTVMIYEVIENICESIFFSGINPGEKLKCGSWEVWETGEERKFMLWSWTALKALKFTFKVCCIFVNCHSETSDFVFSTAYHKKCIWKHEKTTIDKYHLSFARANCFWGHSWKLNYVTCPWPTLVWLKVQLDDPQADSM